MACWMLEIFIAANLAAIALFTIGGAALGRKNRRRGALIGLVLGVFIGPVAVGQLFFDAPKAEPIPDIVVDQSSG